MKAESKVQISCWQKESVRTLELFFLALLQYGSQLGQIKKKHV